MDVGAVANKNLVYSSFFSAGLSLTNAVTNALKPVGIIPLPLPHAKPFNGFNTK